LSMVIAEEKSQLLRASESAACIIYSSVTRTCGRIASHYPAPRFWMLERYFINLMREVCANSGSNSPWLQLVHLMAYRSNCIRRQTKSVVATRYPGPASAYTLPGRPLPWARGPASTVTLSHAARSGGFWHKLCVCRLVRSGPHPTTYDVLRLGLGKEHARKAPHGLRVMGACYKRLTGCLAYQARPLMSKRR